MVMGQRREDPPVSFATDARPRWQDICVYMYVYIYIYICRERDRDRDRDRDRERERYI